MTTLTRRNPLAAQADITLATETNSATALHYDYALVPAEHRSAIMLSARRIKDKAERTKRDILDIGRELTETKAKLEHGQFGDWLSVEFGMSDRMARHFMQVYEVYGAKTETVSVLNDSALYLLSGPSVPEEARQEVEQQAIATGKSPTKAEVQQVIARHKPPAPSARFLTLDETETVLWRTAQHATGSTDRSALAAWFAEHWAVGDYKELLNPGVQISTTTFSQAFQRIRQQFTIKGVTETPVEAPNPPPPSITPVALPTPQNTAIAPSSEAGKAPSRSDRIQALRKLCQGLIDSLPDYGELTGDYSGTLPLRRVLEPMIRKLEENLV